MFRKSVENFTVSSNITTKNGTLREEKYIYSITSLSVLLRMRKCSDIFVEKLETHNSISIIFFLKSVMFMGLCTIVSYDQRGYR